MNAFLAVVVVFTPLIVVGAQILAQRDRHKKAEAISVQTAEIHVLVNSRLTDALERIKALEEALGIEDGDPIPLNPFGLS